MTAACANYSQFELFAILIGKPHRSLFLMTVALLLSLHGFSQSQKEIADRKIKTVTTITTDNRKKDSAPKKVITRYDQRGHVIESIEYDSKNMVKSWEQFTYNRHGQEVSYRQLDADGKAISSTATSYNKWKNVGEKVSSDSAGNILEKIQFEYNTGGDVISETTNDKDGKIQRKVLYEYNQKGMLTTKRIYNATGELIYSREFTYQY